MVIMGMLDWFRTVEPETRGRRSKKEMEIDALEDRKMKLMNEIMDLERQCSRIEHRRADLSEEVLNSIQEYEDKGFEVPSRVRITTGNEIIDFANQAMDTLKVPAPLKMGFMSYASKRPELLEKAAATFDAFVSQKMDDAQKQLNQAAKVIDK